MPVSKVDGVSSGTLIRTWAWFIWDLDGHSSDFAFLLVSL